MVMRLNEIITEGTLEEGPLGAIGRGVAKGLGGLAKGAGMIAGVGKGLKTAYQKGKATSAAHIGGDVPAQPKKPDPEAQATYDKEYKKLTAPQPSNQQEPAAQTAQPAQQPAQTAPAAEPQAQPAQAAQPATQQPPPARAQVAKALVDVASSLESGKDLNDIVGSLEALTRDMKERPQDYDNTNLAKRKESIQRKGRMIESKQKFILYTPQTMRIPVNESSQSKKKTVGIYRQQ